MIIIPINLFSKSIFDQLSIKQIRKLNLSTQSYVVNLDVVEQLKNIEIPFSNKDIAIKKIFEFLQFLDNEIKDSYNDKIEIPQKTFESYFNNRDYLVYKEILKELNILTQTVHKNGIHYSYKNENKELNKCKIYKGGHNYIQSVNLGIVIIEQDRYNKVKVKNEIEGLDKRFVETIKELKIDLQSAVEAELEYYREGHSTFSQLKVRLQRIFCTKRNRYIKKGNKVDRVYHSLTNISRVSRKHLSIDFHNIDVKNCQPLLLCALMSRNNIDFDFNYQKDCENGDFYEQFISDPLERDEIKVQVYKNIFFGFTKKNPVNKKFKELYPLVWQYLFEISKSEMSLASRLQNLESELFNSIIPKKSKYFFTLFDAIYFDLLDDVDSLVFKIKQFFKSIGMNVQVAIEKYNNKFICIH